jgi:hypothetical protein
MRNGLRALVRAGRSTKARVGIGFAAGVWPGWQRRTTRGPGRLADGVKGFVAFFVSSSFLGRGGWGGGAGGGVKLLRSRHRFFRAHGFVVSGWFRFHEGCACPPLL